MFHSNDLILLRCFELGVNRATCNSHDASCHLATGTNFDYSTRLVRFLPLNISVSQSFFALGLSVHWFMYTVTYDAGLCTAWKIWAL